MSTQKFSSFDDDDDDGVIVALFTTLALLAVLAFVLPIGLWLLMKASEPFVVWWKYWLGGA